MDFGGAVRLLRLRLWWRRWWWIREVLERDDSGVDVFYDGKGGVHDLGPCCAAFAVDVSEDDFSSIWEFLADESEFPEREGLRDLFSSFKAI